MNLNNDRLEIIRGALIGTALGILIGHRIGGFWGLLVGMATGFVTGVLMANPFRVCRTVGEIYREVTTILRAAPRQIHLRLKELVLAPSGSTQNKDPNNFSSRLKRNGIVIIKDFGVMVIIFGTFCLTLTQPFIAGLSCDDPAGTVLMNWFVPLLFAVISFSAFMALLTGDNSLLKELTGTRGELAWPLCKMLNSAIYEGEIFKWASKQRLWNSLGLDRFFAFIDNQLETFFHWLESKFKEKSTNEREVSLDRILAMLCTAFLGMVLTTIGAYLFLILSLFFLALTGLIVLLDLPTMIFVRIATRPALAAGEGAATAIFLEGIFYRSFEAASGYDWLRLILFSLLGAILGISAYALRQRLITVGAIVKET
ncbi:MAG: hypothetical protein WCT25_03110 [Candidatus Paceibacterota bacterium]